MSWSLFTVRMAVDLPDPDSPITTKISPLLTEKDTLSRPTTWPVSACTLFLSIPERAKSKARPLGWGPNIL